MNKVKVYAYTKFNLGDDLFIKVLCDRYPTTQFLLYAPDDYRQVFKNTKNLRCYRAESLVNRTINKVGRLLKIENIIDRYLIKQSDAIVQIGGSLFIQGDNWKDYLNRYEKQRRMKGKPFFLLGANFGPYSNEEFYEEYKQLFAGDTDICFREAYSYELFKDLPNVRVADDIVFSMQTEESTDENYVVISVIKPSYRKDLNEMDELYYEKMKEIGMHYIDEGKEVIYMSFCQCEGDEEAVSEIIKRLPTEYQKKSKSFYYRSNLEEALDVIRCSSVVVASRFHAMILGFLYGKRVLPFIYSKKMKNVLEDLEFKGVSFEIQYLNQSVNSFDLSLNTINSFRAIKDAQNHFKKLDDLLGEFSATTNDFCHCTRL